MLYSRTKINERDLSFRNKQKTISDAQKSASFAIYKNILRPIFFRQDPEKVHERMTSLGEFFGRLVLGYDCTLPFIPNLFAIPVKQNVYHC